MPQQIQFDNNIAELLENYDNGYVLFLQFEENASDACPNHYNFTISCPSEENAGVDLCSVEDWKQSPGEPAHLLDLGVRAMLVNITTRETVNYWLLPRSSIYKTGHMMANSVGVIDNSYRGILKAPVVAVQTGAVGFKKGNRYFQIVAPDMGPIHLVRAVSSLPSTERGDDGFGSTGVN